MRVARGVLRGTNFFGATADGRMRVAVANMRLRRGPVCAPP
jgi:hypothetical protein